MNPYQLGHGPYFHRMQGRFFVTIEIPTPPSTLPSTLSPQPESTAFTANLFIPSRPTQGPFTPPPLDPFLFVEAQELDLTLLTDPFIPPPDNSFPFGNVLSQPMSANMMGVAPIHPFDIPSAAGQTAPMPSEACTPLFQGTPESSSSASPPPTSNPVIVTQPTSFTAEEPPAVKSHSRHQCPLCTKPLDIRRSLHRHLWAKHEDYARQNNIPCDRVKCPECGLKMRKDNLKRHAERHRRKGIS